MQTIKGDGYTFEAPADWAVARSANGLTASSGAVDRLEVSHFTLQKPYRVARFAAVSAELDRVVDGLAQQVSGKVATARTTEIAGRKTRWYQIDFGPGKTEEIAFVLLGTDEYQVLCRRGSSEDDASCAQLFSSFALS